MIDLHGLTAGRPSARRQAEHSANPAFRRSWASCALVCVLLVAAARPAHADDFVKPTPEELAMTSLPKYPGAPAAVLFKEEITKDDLHSVQRYNRIKILTEEGKKYANVELGYVSSSGYYGGFGDNKSVEGIEGRTIHPDGTIIPFTGKPYLKVVVKASGFKVQEKVFTLPDVTVGSIIEYRYATRINDNVVEPPTWTIQEELFVKSAHFAWWPTSQPMVDESQKRITSIAWFPILPPDAKIESHVIPGGIIKDSYRIYELHINDVPPTVREEYMPPIASFGYGVRFSFTPYSTPQEYWTEEGKAWSKRVNILANPNDALTKETDEILSGATTPDEKLRRLYAAVMKLENTDFTRERDTREDKAAGNLQIKSAADILTNKRGTPYQLTELFLAMARSAGFTAYAMYVPDRSETLFVPQWLSFNQLSALIAIVNIDGKEQFFDPGSRYCPFGQLAWQHDLVQGVRQTDNGTALGTTPTAPYKLNRTSRVANLTMTANGEITGKVDLTFTGSPAVDWRQTALRGDEASLRKDLREHAEELLPKTLEVEVADIKDITDYEKPLTVSYKVKGTLGTSMGKRMLLPADVFLVNESATFPHDTRDTAVYFHYARVQQDAVRINLPQDLTIEAAPTSATYSDPKVASYAMNVTPAANNVTVRRDFVFGDIFVLPKDYPDLRKFYAQFESKYQENVILKSATTKAENNPPAAPATK